MVHPFPMHSVASPVHAIHCTCQTAKISGVLRHNGFSYDLVPIAPLPAALYFPALGQGHGNNFFLGGGGGGGKSVDMPSDCQNLGGAQAYPSH